jgi:sensor domain CHASE-containing protein
MVRLLKSEIKSITVHSNELKKTIETYEQERQKSKLVEQLLVVKTEIEEELKTQVRHLTNTTIACLFTLCNT